MKLRVALLAAICISSCATAYAQDTSAQLQVTGAVSDSESSCALSLSASSITLRSVNLSSLPSQGGNEIATNDADSLAIHMTGDKCKTTGLKFVGNTDKTEGNTLVNSLTSNNSAKGVGIGIYNPHGDAIDFSKTVSPTWELYQGNYAIYLRMVKLTGETPTMGEVQSSLTVQLESL